MLELVDFLSLRLLLCLMYSHTPFLLVSISHCIGIKLQPFYSWINISEGDEGSMERVCRFGGLPAREDQLSPVRLGIVSRMPGVFGQAIDEPVGT